MIYADARGDEVVELDKSVLDDAEKITLALRALYQRCGYTRYRMGKFEEYDLYARNKDFLLSDNIITFTDTNGKLMALKPDVTLSVIKNHRDEPDTLRKFCYNESVYRVSRGSGAFRELMQVGVECVGSVDVRCVGENLRLAAESLALCAERFVLEVSHLDILRRFLYDVTDDAVIRGELLKCVGEKNAHSISAICRSHALSWNKAEALRALVETYGAPAEVLPRLDALCAGRGLDAELQYLRDALSVVEEAGLGDKARVDFSTVSNMNYYNGILFKGFIEGIPDSVLSGGQYDKLMRKMGKRSKAVGFAVYLDRLERLSETDNRGVIFRDA